jgi:hypothetical protein
VLTTNCARTLAAAALSIVTLCVATLGHADGIIVGGCVGVRGSFNCAMKWGQPSDPYVRLVPHASSEAEIAKAQERDRDWMDRCKPVVAHDRYGIERYQYATRGCEYGAGSN